VARPSKATTATVETIETALVRGATIPMAAAAAGVSPRTVSGWLREGVVVRRRLRPVPDPEPPRRRARASESSRSGPQSSTRSSTYSPQSSGRAEGTTATSSSALDEGRHSRTAPSPSAASAQRAKPAGLGWVAPHDLRRSFCSLAARRGVDPVAAAELTGHSLAVWATSYARSYGREQRREARERLLDHGFGAVDPEGSVDTALTPEGVEQFEE
jgi:hypothetical protein